MINISHLTKIYRSKKKQRSKALDDLSLTLPNNGLVFVLGKSGSGKSTLLNLIGGLDRATSGQIQVDGDLISGLREGKLCDYRNCYVGFIFQDYHLIDELTVYENIRLCLSLLDTDDDKAIYEALEKVDLLGFENRFPTELSGGQRQRVAIARAIVKHPRLILADEPTGNLDNKTATQIIQILKKLSRECLVLIVSHSTTDAYAYADRIIKLSEGKIVGDSIRNPHFSDRVHIDADTLVYPQNTCLNDADLAVINDGLSTGSIRKILQQTDKFIPAQEPVCDRQTAHIRHAGLNVSNFRRLCLRFLKNKAAAIGLSAFMVAVIMVILALAQTIIAFDANRIIADEMANANLNTLFFTKLATSEDDPQLDKDYYMVADEADIQAFYDAGYEGTIYPVWNITVPVTDYRHAAGIHTTYFGAGPYMSETFGTMIVDEAFLEKTFGQLQYAAKLDTFSPAGVIITDYVADAILELNAQYAGKDYTDILGPHKKAGMVHDTITINAILDTGYRQRHADILRQAKNGDFETVSQMYQDDAFIALSNEIYGKLGFSYSINPDFVEAYTDTYQSSTYLYCQKLQIDQQFLLEPDALDRRYFYNGDAFSARISSYYYTQTAPTVPQGAKYMRLSFANPNDVRYSSVFAQLPVADKGCAHVVFSNGEEVSYDLLNATANAWLDPETGALLPQIDYPDTYVSAFIPIPEGCSISEFCTLALQTNVFCAFYDEDQQFIDAYAPEGREPMPDGTVVMNYYQYNKLFGSDYNNTNLDTFVPHSMQLTGYRLYDTNYEDPLFTTQVQITGLSKNEWLLGKDVAALFHENQYYIYGIYFDGADGISYVTDVAETRNFTHQSFLIEGIFTMTQAVEVFVPIFWLVAILLCIGVIFILINFGSKMIQDKLHEIGILKALGAKNATVGAIFGMQVVCIALLTCALSTAGYFLFIDLANDVLMESLTRIAPSRILLNIDFLTFQPTIAAINCAMICAMSALALTVPLLKIRKVEPVKIIRARE